MSRPHTIVAWQALYESGASVRDTLVARRAEIASTGVPVYLHVASVATLEAQIESLVQRAAACTSPAQRAALLPLYGVPFVVKDNIDIAGAPTTAACPAYAYTPERNATVVQRLLDAGAVWLAKTNLDQFATGLVGTRSPHGAPESVLVPGRISGGSSSGSAVAVARGDVPFSLGTDTAGSGRVPAAFNGLVGLKPTPGRVSTAGVLPACRTLDCVSVLAHHVSDAAAVLALIEGADRADTYSAFAPGPALLPARLRLGVPADMPAMEPGYAEAFEAACQQALAAGHELVPLDFKPLFDIADLLYSGPWVAERHTVVRTLLQQQPDSMDPVVRNVIEQAKRFSATDAFAAQYHLREASRPAQALWQRADLLLVPTVPRHPTFKEVAADPVGVNAELGLFTNFVNLLGWCALALPAGLTAAGLPFGATFIGRAGLDAALARFAGIWRGEGTRAGAAGCAGDRPPALPWPAAMPTLALAVVGAHLSGLPLNWQLTERGATLRQATHTAPRYRLFALPGTTPPKPGLLRVDGPGHAIALEVWDMPLTAVGSFLALIPAPLSLGSIELEDGAHVHGFLCEPYALQGAADISAWGGWRAHLAHLAAPVPPTSN